MASVGRVEEANKLVAEKLGSEYKVIVEEKKEEEKVSVAELFGPKYRRNTLVGGMFYACQVFPYFGIGIFLPILIGQLNMGDSNTSSIIYDVFCMAGAFAGTWLCAKLSRRTFLLPILMDSIGGTGTLVVCAAVLILGGVVCQLFAPETSASYLKKVAEKEAAAN